MGIDARDVQVFVYRVLEFSMKTSYRFVQKHPYVFGVFSFFFLLYIFFPLIFIILVCSSPFLVFIAVLLRTYWSSHQSHIRSVNGDEKSSNVILQEKSKSAGDDVVVSRNDGSHLQSHTSRRRNVKEKNKELDIQTGKKEENENTTGKITMEEKEFHSSEHGESSFANMLAAKGIQNVDDEHHALLDSESRSEHISSDGAEQTRKFDNSGIELEADNMEEAEDDDEEEAQEDGNKALEWTEDDQKNLRDLGLSELERNKRLESLIAKRRARKLFRMQAEKGLIDLDSNPQGQIAPIVAKSNPFDVPNISEETEGLQMPSSAPCILLPTGNPFDLPYDPLEEKPNLMGGSFQQEFMSDNQKEMLFCRHESFQLGPSFPSESMRDRNGSKFNPPFVSEKGTQNLEGPGYSRFQMQSKKGEPNQQTERLFSKDGDESIFPTDSTPDLAETGAQAPSQVINSAEINREEDKITKDNMTDIKGEEEMEGSHGMGSMYTSEVHTDIKGEEEMERSHGMGSMYTSEVHMEPNLSESSNDDSDSSASSEENEQTLNDYKVEFSKNPKPSPSPSLSLKSIRCLPPKPESEPLFDTSPSADGKHRREGSAFFPDKAYCHTPTHSIASDLQVEFSDGSPPLTLDGTNSAIDAESETYDEDMEKEATFGSEGMWGSSSVISGLQDYESKSGHEDSQKDIVEVGVLGMNKNFDDDIMSSIGPQRVDDQELTDMSSLSSSAIDISGESQVQSKNIKHMIHDDIKQVVEEVKEPKPKSSNYSDSQIHVGKSMAHSPNEVYSEKPKEMSTRNEKTIDDANYGVSQATTDMKELKINEDIGGGSQLVIKQETEKLTENQAILDSVKPTEGNKDSKNIEDVGGSQIKLTEDEGIMDISKPIEANDNLDSIQENKNEQSITESGTSGLNQNSDDPIASAAQQELVVEEVPIDSSSSSSPTSVLAGKIPTDQASSSTSDQQLHIVILQSHLEDIANTYSWDEQPPLNITPGAQPMVENFTAPPSTNSGFENLMDPSNPQEKPAEETHSFDDLNVPKVNEKEGKENTKSHQTIKGESEILISHEGSASLSKPAEDSSNILRTVEPGKFTAEDNTIFNVNDREVSEKKDKEKYNSVGKSEDESQSSIKQESIVDSLKPDKPTSSKFIDVDEKSRKLNDVEALHGTSKSLEGIENSRTKEETEDSRKPNEHDPIFRLPKSADTTFTQETIKGYEVVGGESENLTDEVVDLSNPALEKGYPKYPATIAEVVPSNSPEKSAVETQSFDNLNVPMVNDEDGREISKSYQAIKGESETLISHEGSAHLSKPAEDIDNILGIKEPRKFTAKDNTIYNVNDPEDREKEDKEMSKFVAKSEGESQFSIKQESTVYSQKPVEPTSSKFIDVDEKSRKLNESLLGPSNSIEDIKNSRTKEETENSGKPNEHDPIFHPPKSADNTYNQKAIKDVGGESENLTVYEPVDSSKPAVEKGYPSFPTTIAEEDPLNPLEKSAEVTHSFDNLNVPMVHDKEGKKNSKSHQAIKGESETFISHKGSGFLSTPAEDSSNILGTKEPGNFTKKDNNIYNVNDPEDSEKKDIEKSVGKSESESQSSIKQESTVYSQKLVEPTSSKFIDVDEKSRKLNEALLGPSNSIEDIKNSRTKEETKNSGKPNEPDPIFHPPKSHQAIKGETETFISHKGSGFLSTPAEDSSNILGTKEPGNFTKKDNNIYNVNDPEDSEKKDIEKSVGKSESESQSSIKQESTVYSQKPVEPTSSKFIDVNEKSRKLNEALLGPSNSIEDIKNSRTKEETKNSGKPNEPDPIFHPPKSADTTYNQKAIKHVGGESENLTVYEAVDFSKPAVEKGYPNLPATIAKEDSFNTLEKSAEETHSFDNMNVPMVNDKERNENSKSHQAIKGETEKLISHKGSGFLSTPAEDRSNKLGTKEPAKFTAEDNTIFDVNDLEVCEKENKEKFNSVGKSEGESQSSFKQESIVDSPKPDEPTTSKFIDVDKKSRILNEGEALLGPSKSFEDIKNSRTKEETEASRKPNEHDPIFHPSKSADTTCNQETIKHVGGEFENLKVHEVVNLSKPAVEKGYPNVPTTIAEEEPSNPPKKSAVETHNFDYLHVPKINDKEGKENSKSHQAIKGESETWISYDGRAYPSKPAEDSTKILGTMEPGKFTAEDNTINIVNDPEVSEKEDKGKSKSVGKSKGESQSSIKQESNVDFPKPDEQTSSKFINVDEKSRKLNEFEAILGPSKSFEEIEKSRTKEETEDSRKPNEHDPIFHPPKSVDTTFNQETIKHVGGESENLTVYGAVDLSKRAVEKGYPNAPTNIAKEEPSYPHPLKSYPES
ncbi:uncharacterized protein LOC115985190 isoform X2 [Quercus lobata]|uniref:uncharacterized protein LOC115985190 isoform X2 n=1 Tax=Quercus lobata TaxID=97700 RepID=UPI00124902F8|nr:uncharacterized protein LOC115985190 isoform X2 [Quercus lobata]